MDSIALLSYANCHTDTWQLFFNLHALFWPADKKHFDISQLRRKLLGIFERKMGEN